MRKVSKNYKHYIKYNCNVLIDDLKQIQKEYPGSNMKDIFIKTSMFAFENGFDMPKAMVIFGDAVKVYNDNKGRLAYTLDEPTFREKVFYAVLKKD